MPLVAYTFVPPTPTCFFINCIVLTSLLIAALKPVGQYSSNFFMMVSPMSRALSRLTSSGDILPFAMMRMPTSGCYALSTGFIGKTKAVKVLQAGRQLLELDNSDAALAGVVFSTECTESSRSLLHLETRWPGNATWHWPNQVLQAGRQLLELDNSDAALAGVVFSTECTESSRSLLHLETRWPGNATWHWPNHAWMEERCHQ